MLFMGVWYSFENNWILFNIVKILIFYDIGIFYLDIFFRENIVNL